MSSHRQDDNKLSKCSIRRSPIVVSEHPSENGRIGATRGAVSPGGAPLPATIQTRSPKVTQPSAAPATTPPSRPKKRIKHPTSTPSPRSRPPAPGVDPRIAGAIRSARVRAGMTQAELATRAHMGRSVYIDKELSQTSFSTDQLASVSSALGITVKQLLTVPQMAHGSVIAQRLLAARLAKRLSLQDAAEAVEIDDMVLRNFERNGSTDIELLTRLAALYDSTLDAIINVGDEPSLSISIPAPSPTSQVLDDRNDRIEIAVSSVLVAASALGTDPKVVLTMALAEIAKAVE